MGVGRLETEIGRRAAFPLRVLYGCRPPDVKTCGRKKTAWFSDAGTADFGVSKLLTSDGTAAVQRRQVPTW
ncbi:hypothetical protein [Xylella fastidiosa]|uniref:hypothetical protein n=1 Tax=Xylella fastidiosa TaxID=2371 RepID=UPI0013E2F2DE|nr:hypothetical protein [Xylella fastidiosa]